MAVRSAEAETNVLHAFVVAVPTRNYFLHAASFAEARAWMAALEGAAANALRAARTESLASTSEASVTKEPAAPAPVPAPGPVRTHQGVRPCGWRWCSTHVAGPPYPSWTHMSKRPTRAMVSWRRGVAGLLWLYGGRRPQPGTQQQWVLQARPAVTMRTTTMMTTVTLGRPRTAATPAKMTMRTRGTRPASVPPHRPCPVRHSRTPLPHSPQRPPQQRRWHLGQPPAHRQPKGRRPSSASTASRPRSLKSAVCLLAARTCRRLWARRSLPSPTTPPGWRYAARVSPRLHLQ
jgi:hypothetical protein